MDESTPLIVGLLLGSLVFACLFAICHAKCTKKRKEQKKLTKVQREKSQKDEELEEDSKALERLYKKHPVPFPFSPLDGEIGLRNYSHIQRPVSSLDCVVVQPHGQEEKILYPVSTIYSQRSRHSHNSLNMANEKCTQMKSSAKYFSPSTTSDSKKYAGKSPSRYSTKLQKNTELACNPVLLDSSTLNTVKFVHPSSGRLRYQMCKPAN